MKKLLSSAFIFIFFISLVYALDEQNYVSCGGDKEVIIGCVGDQELIFIGQVEEGQPETEETVGSTLTPNISPSLRRSSKLLFLTFFGVFVILSFFVGKRLILGRKEEEKDEKKEKDDAKH